MYTLDVKRDFFDSLLEIDAQYMEDASTGDLTTTLIWYMDECMHFVIRNIIHFSNNILKIAAMGVYLMLISWQVGVFALVAAPISVFVNARFGRKIREYGEMERESYSKYSGWVFEILSALRDIRMLGAQARTDKLFEASHRDLFAVRIKSGIASLTAGNIISFSNLCVQLLIFAFAGYSAASGHITVGLLTVIVTFYAQLTSDISQASTYYLDSQNRISYIQRVYDILHAPSERDWGGNSELRVTEGKIVFRDIKFAYHKGNAVLDGFDLEIGAGERFALVGKSGSGKTTLAYMLIGFYRPGGGYIEIDGQKLSECSLKSIRRSVGLIQQDVLIFDGTVRENILLGNRMASDAEIEAACRQAGIWAFIKELPRGLETEIGAKGVGLSGGQKQRVAIARIYLKNPRIIIFDEATSSLDSETEEAIHEAIR
jgi:ABC-type multidrug transport system fused ATPase/permease subunit